jgi:hypothetical protein
VRASIELYTPATLGWVAFLCGVPAGLVLAALNYLSMGEDGKAKAHLAGAAGVLAALFAGTTLGPLGALLNLAVLVSGIVYLVRDARASAADYRDAHPAYAANGFQGFLTGLCLAAVSAAAYFMLVAPLLG